MTEGGGRLGGKAQQATLTCPPLREPWWTQSHCPPDPTQATRPLQQPLSYYHNFPERRCSGVHERRGIRVLQNVWCFIAFKSLLGQLKERT